MSARQEFTRRAMLTRAGWLAGAAAAASPFSLLSACGAPSKSERLNVLLVTLDTTRASNLGCYGYTRDTSPNLDALAEGAEVYTRMTATSSWTLPSHASLFTGRFPTSHGALFDPKGPLVFDDGGETHAGAARYRARGIGGEEPTLAAILAAAGYRTAGIVAGPWMRRDFGLDRGFETYDDDEIRPPQGRRAVQVTSRALGWLAAVAGKPFFLFLNYFDPHFPYAPPPGFASEFGPVDPDDRNASAIAGYDGEIRYMDFQLSRVFDQLRNLGLYERTLIVVTADHGELLGEHGTFGHGNYLFEEELRIPLIVRYPEGDKIPGTLERRVCQTDVLPLILARLGLPLPDAIQGEVPSERRHPIVAETYPLSEFSAHGHWRALYDDNFKFLWNSERRHRLFDLEADPGEARNLLRDRPDRGRAMNRRLQRYLASLPRPSAAPPGSVDLDTRDALRELGYLGGDEPGSKSSEATP